MRRSRGAGLPDADGTGCIKEGKETNLNESFACRAAGSLIGVSCSATTRSTENERAGGYELKGCDSTTATSLVTNQAIDATTNPSRRLSASRRRSVASGAAGGVATTITEPSSSSPNYARQSEVCVAKPGTNCGDSTYLAQDFGPAVITSRFQVSDIALKADPTLPKGYKIEKSSTTASQLTRGHVRPRREPGMRHLDHAAAGQPEDLDDRRNVRINGPWNW